MSHIWFLCGLLRAAPLCFVLFWFGFCFLWPKCSLRTGQGSPVKGKKDLISIDCVVQDPLLMCHGSTHDSYSPVVLGWGEVWRWNHRTSFTPMQTLGNIDTQKHTETKKKMFRHQWGSFFFPPAQSQLTSWGLMRSLELVKQNGPLP